MFLSRKKFNELSTKVDAIASHVGISDTQTLIAADEALRKDEERRLKVAYALNLCTVSISQIIDYSDIYILEQEYDAILNNLNIQNFIKDESLLKVLKQILDTITFFRIQEGDKKFIEKEYQQKMKNAIWSAVPNLSVIFAGGSLITMAIAAATQVGIGYMNYRKNKNQYIIEKEKQDWELQRSAIEQFNGLRRELFESAWRLSEKYDFPDKYRLTEKQITQYNEILLDPDPLRRYERLDSISEIFGAFPPYWYYKGNAAKEISHLYETKSREIAESYKKSALENYQMFHKIYTPFMREDVIAASCFLENLALLPRETEVDEKKKLLDDTVELAGNNLDILQLCVFHYIEINDDDKAEFLLRKLVNEDYNTSLNGKILSRLYWKKGDRNKYDVLKDRIGPVNIIPWIDNLEEVAIKEAKNGVIRNYLRFVSFIEQYDKTLRKKYTIPDDFKSICNDFVVQLQESQKNNEKEIRSAFLVALINANFPMRINNFLNDVFSDFAYSKIVTIGKDTKGDAWKGFFKDEAERLMKQNAAIFDETLYMFSINKKLKTSTIVASGLLLGIPGLLVSTLLWKQREKQLEGIPSLPIKQMGAGINTVCVRLSYDAVFNEFFNNLRKMFKEQISLIGKFTDTGEMSISHDMVNNILEDMFQKNQFLLPPEITNPEIDISDLNLVFQDESKQNSQTFFVLTKGSRKYFEYALEYPNFKNALENIIITSIPNICKPSDNVSYNIESVYQGSTSDAVATILLTVHDSTEKSFVFCYDKIIIINGNLYSYSDGFEKIKNEIQPYQNELNSEAFEKLFEDINILYNNFEAELGKLKAQQGEVI
ncbi:hypothetical protein LQZ21_09060 [Treponema sp. TIM-1]|uniref:hypothetical protein n=1 Tax=Treponema sp. TIM-1 TaxID=2898417 RepID=UPI0039806F30